MIVSAAGICSVLVTFYFILTILTSFHPHHNSERQHLSTIPIVQMGKLRHGKLPSEVQISMPWQCETASSVQKKIIIYKGLKWRFISIDIQRNVFPHLNAYPHLFLFSPATKKKNKTKRENKVCLGSFYQSFIMCPIYIKFNRCLKNTCP